MTNNTDINRRSCANEFWCLRRENWEFGCLLINADKPFRLRCGVQKGYRSNIKLSTMCLWSPVTSPGAAQSLSFSAFLFIYFKTLPVTQTRMSQKYPKDYYYYWYIALGPVWAETRVQSGDWYDSGKLDPGQVLGLACHCFPPLFRCSHFSPPGASTSATTWEIPAAEVGAVGENVVR